LYPFEIFLKAGIGGLEYDSKMILDQIRSIDKQRFIRKLGCVDKLLLVEACTIAQKLIAVR
jgi:mRNA interferase MazF